MSADVAGASDELTGALGVGAEAPAERAPVSGPDPITFLLGSLGATLEDIQRTRKSALLRSIATGKQGQNHASVEGAALAEMLKPVEQAAARKLKNALKKHVLYPWLEQYPGLAGPTTGRLIAVIADPFRFPGRKCEGGHYLPETYGGELCPVETVGGDEVGSGRTEGADSSSENAWSSGPCLAPVHHRRGSGVRSLYHYLGLHVVNGRSPRKQRGVQGDWNTRGRTLVLQPDGIADQIVKQRVPRYRDTYDATKERLQRERGAVSSAEGDEMDGLALSVVAEGAEPVGGGESTPGPLRPIQIHDIARKVAAKAFVADLLIEWKALTK